MTLKKLIAAYGIMAVIVIAVNLAILAAAVWLVVKVLQWTGVL
jgi:hypothetical protein